MKISKNLSCCLLNFPKLTEVLNGISRMNSLSVCLAGMFYIIYALPNDLIYKTTP